MECCPLYLRLQLCSIFKEPLYYRYVSHQILLTIMLGLHGDSLEIRVALTVHCRSFSTVYMTTDFELLTGL
jgi:hypothetical protein